MSDMKEPSKSRFLNFNRCVALSRSGRLPSALRHQEGAFGIMFVAVLLVLWGFCGLALDASRLYNRKAEMQNVADSVALAAARRLNGTPGGITNAVAAASAAATALNYQYNSTPIPWPSDAALKFSTSPDRNGSWVDAGTAAATAARIFYVKVDTTQLASVNDVDLIFMPALSSSLSTSSITADAIAGRVEINVSPLAVCAMSNTPAAARNNSASYVELVEYGFRRGVSYDLMNLNPGGTTPMNFVVNPLAPPGSSGSASDMLPSNVGPYVCTGSLGIPRVTGDPITVAQPFPIDPLYKQLNSRFDQYDDGLCNFHAAPPDINIRAYTYTGIPGTFPWANTAPAGQTAATDTSTGKLQTRADLPPPGGTAAQYGPLWAYAKAVPFSAYSAGTPEPYPNGYTTFPTASWPTLYGGQTVKTYPSGSSTPYKATTAPNALAPSAVHRPGGRDRRVLNVPLLSCPVATGGSASATVLAVGRFFMTVPATSASVPAEFAGIVPVQNVEGKVELFP